MERLAFYISCHSSLTTIHDLRLTIHGLPTFHDLRFTDLRVDEEKFSAVELAQAGDPSSPRATGNRCQSKALVTFPAQC